MPKLTFFELVTKEQLAFKEDSPDFNLVGGAGRKAKDKMPGTRSTAITRVLPWV